MRASEVHGGHLGRKVTIRGKDITVEEGTLRSVTHDGDLISEKQMFSSEPWYAVGSSMVLLTLLPDSKIRLRPTDIVELLD